MKKYPIDPARIRHLPPRFSWLDQRLVTDGHLEQCARASQALYLFLAVVSDAQGLSYYSEKSICTRLAMPREELAAARRGLIERELLAFKPPLYQLLSLDPFKAGPSERAGRMLSIGELIALPEKP